MKEHKKPDWMLRAGIALWIVLGWATIRFFGWHIPSWFWWTVLITIVGMIFQYAQTLEAQRDAERAQEIKNLKQRIEEMEMILAELRSR